MSTLAGRPSSDPHARPAPVRILGVSGSLRARSSNTEALGAVATLAPPDVRVHLYDGLGGLPHFNPDLDAEGMTPPPAVAALRRRVAEADALLVSTPEYAHGVPGTLKNAFDWLVSDPCVVHKPVGVLGLSPRSRHGPAALVETLRTMSMTVVPLSPVALSGPGRGWSAAQMARDADLSTALSAVIDALVAAIRA